MRWPLWAPLRRGRQLHLPLRALQRRFRDGETSAGQFSSNRSGHSSSLPEVPLHAAHLSDDAANGRSKHQLERKPTCQLAVDGGDGIREVDSWPGGQG